MVAQAAAVLETEAQVMGGWVAVETVEVALVVEVMVEAEAAVVGMARESMGTVAMEVSLGAAEAPGACLLASEVEILAVAEQVEKATVEAGLVVA